MSGGTRDGLQRGQQGWAAGLQPAWVAAPFPTTTLWGQHNCGHGGLDIPIRGGVGWGFWGVRE